MTVTDKKFEAAANDIKQLTKRPDDEDMLRLYALYKQGSVGDVDGKRPGFTDMVGRAAMEEITGPMRAPDATAEALEDGVDVGDAVAAEAEPVGCHTGWKRRPLVSLGKK